MGNKKSHLFRAPLPLLAAGALLFCLGCSPHRANAFYELVGGDPTVDYLELMGDTACRYCVPGSLEVVTPCHVDEATGVITVDVAGFVKGYLLRVNADTLIGRAPFFEGVWVAKPDR